MFLHWLEQLGLFKHSNDTNILDIFPVETRVQIIQQVTNSNSLTDLKSEKHILWVMEVIGAGLALPLEHYPIITQAANIYSQWLIEKRPFVLNELYQQVD